MPLAIRLATHVSPQRLRDLIMDNLDALVGEGARAWDDMPALDDCCLGVLDAQNELTLVSFDPADPTRALTNGLGRMDELGSDLAARLLSPYRPPARLLVLAPEPPPGASALARSGFVDWATFRVLNVNGEFGLLLESGARERQPASPRPGEDAEAALTGEERRFFQAI
jgi:hypothetical protein